MRDAVRTDFFAILLIYIFRSS